MSEEWGDLGELAIGLGEERRALATAWLAPLPPEPVEKEVAVKVSPPEGTRGVRVTRSVFREPMIVIVLCAILRGWRRVADAGAGDRAKLRGGGGRGVGGVGRVPYWKCQPCEE